MMLNANANELYQNYNFEYAEINFFLHLLALANLCENKINCENFLDLQYTYYIV